jgi:hypothetical protein
MAHPLLRQRVPLPSRWLVLAVAGVAMLGVWVEYRTIFGRQPGIVLLMLFSGLKVLETRTHRDAAAAAFLGYFLIVTNFLYTQSIPTALAMALALFAITATLTGFSAPNRAAGEPAHCRPAVCAWCRGGGAVPALPRVQGSLWPVRRTPTARTGSETMAPAKSRAWCCPRTPSVRNSRRRARRRATGAGRCGDFDAALSAGRSPWRPAPPGGASASGRYRWCRPQ